MTRHPIARRKILIRIAKVTVRVKELGSVRILNNHSQPDSLTPLQRYRKLVDTGALRGDEHQTRIIQKLQDLHEQLIGYDPPRIPDPASNSMSIVCIPKFQNNCPSFNSF